MDSFPELYTDRLHLRKLLPEDIPDLLKHVNNTKITDQIVNFPYPYQEPDAVFRLRYVNDGYKNKSRFCFAIILRSKEEMIGEISLHIHKNKSQAELGYWLGEEYWNQGFMTESIQSVVNFAQDVLGLQQLNATCYEDNQASANVLIKNGFKSMEKSGRIISFRFTKEDKLQKNN